MEYDDIMFMKLPSKLHHMGRPPPLPLLESEAKARCSIFLSALGLDSGLAITKDEDSVSRVIAAISPIANAVELDSIDTALVVVRNVASYLGTLWKSTNGSLWKDGENLYLSAVYSKFSKSGKPLDDIRWVYHVPANQAMIILDALRAGQHVGCEMVLNACCDLAKRRPRP